MMIKTGAITAGLLLLLSWRTSAQQELPTDTLRIPIDSAENIFVRQNLSLLAQKFNVSAEDALILQAKLWPNPNLSFGTLVYNQLNGQWFPFGSFGEVTASVSQLILLANKRGWNIKIAKANTQLAEYQLYDLLRTLKHTLATDFYSIYFQQQSATVYEEEINALQTVVNAYNQQEGKGYIAESDVVRIKAQLYSLQSEYNDLINQINDTESELKLVLQVRNTVYVVPMVDSATLASMDPARYTLNTLLDSAYKNRTDLLIAKENYEINKLTYSYQRALAVPDLTMSLNYDQQAGYPNNETSLGASIDLPFLNRNQGNIKSAKALMGFADATEKGTEATVAENVYRALQKAYAEQKLYKNIDPAFMGEFDKLSKAVLDNYMKRNIGLLQFLDFYDAYKTNVVQVNGIASDRMGAFEDIDYYTASNMY